MPLPKDILESIKGDIAEAEKALAELKDVVSDMRLAGMDTTKQDAEVDSLDDEIRKLKVFYGRQIAKSS